METDFRALLAEDPTIAGLVSTRIYPANYTQSATNPALRYNKITGAPGLHMQGGDGLDVDVIQVDIRAVNAIDALNLRDALVSLLHGYSGTKGDTQFQAISLRDDRGTRFETTGAQSFYTRSLDFDISSRAAA